MTTAERELKRMKLIRLHRLVKDLHEAQADLDFLIMSTATGPRRERLTEVNIQLLDSIVKLTDIAKEM